MYIKYDSLSRFEPLVMTLCNPGSIFKDGAPTNAVGMLIDTTDEEIVANFNALSELNFVIHDVKRPDEEEYKYTNYLYKAMQPRRLVFIKGIGYFVVTEINEDLDVEGQRYKDVRAESIEHEIQNKKVPYIEDNTYQFLNETSTKKGLFNILVDNLPLWKIGFVDEAVAGRFRTFEDVSPELNILGFMYEEMQEAYECIFIFDTIHRIINVYDQNNYVRKTSIHLTKEDVIQNINITENADDLYTAITVLGDENVMIAALNPLGTNTIYDFSYYTNWMTPSLGEKVIRWQEEVKNSETSYHDLNLQYYQKMEELATHNHELEALNTQITIYRRCRDNIVAEASTNSIAEYNKVLESNGGTAIEEVPEIGEAITQIDRLIATCESKRVNEQTVIKSLKEEIDTIKASIDEIHNRLALKSYFSAGELGELTNYLYEGSYTDDYVTFTDIMSYTEKFEQMQILYDRAKKTLEKASKPVKQFDIDSENFIFIKEFGHWSEQLETGCLINVEIEDGDIALLFLANVTINYDDHTLSLTFGSRFEKFDPKALFEDVLGKISKSSNTLGFIKDTIFPIKQGELNRMQEALETSRDLTLDVAMSSSGEDVLIDGTGYTGRKKLSNGEYDPRQVKINGRNIVFTDDAWETCKVAIGELILGDNASAYGINAKTIIGEMIIGNNLKIVDNQGNDIFKVMDNKISANLSNYDDRLTQIEANAGSLEIEITELSKNSGKATSVTTTSGYTFDKDGLTIQKSGEEMTNVLDNTGMYVKRSGTTILEANNEGVIAINLTARQYLHVGKHSRFEDYSTAKDAQRTACFYVNDTGGKK